MSERAPKRLMIPFSRRLDYCSLDARLIVYGRLEQDYQSDCLLFRASARAAMTGDDVARLRRLGAEVCYVYDVLDFENREFTPEGFAAINSDIGRAVGLGFTHIMVSNAYLVELLTNEYRNLIKVIISPLLECNSARSHVFFEVLNDASSISHLVVSQNHLTLERFEGMKRVFDGVQLIVEADRWSSDIQMIHEHYYNVLYGRYQLGAVAELVRLTRSERIRRHLAPCKHFLRSRGDVTYKIGELNAPAELVRANLDALLRGDFDAMRMVDLELWRAGEEAAHV